MDKPVKRPNFSATCSGWVDDAKNFVAMLDYVDAQLARRDVVTAEHAAVTGSLAAAVKTAMSMIVDLAGLVRKVVNVSSTPDTTHKPSIERAVPPGRAGDEALRRWIHQAAPNPKPAPIHIGPSLIVDLAKTKNTFDVMALLYQSIPGLVITTAP